MKRPALNLWLILVIDPLIFKPKPCPVFSFLALTVLLLVSCSTNQNLPTKEITLIATDIAWDLSQIEIELGQPVSITLINNGILDHNFTIDSLDVDFDIQVGATEVISFISSNSGKYNPQRAFPRSLLRQKHSKINE